jgi:HSP20 family protein
MVRFGRRPDWCVAPAETAPLADLPAGAPADRGVRGAGAAAFEGCIRQKGGDSMTTLVKWAPFRDFDLMERNIRRLFEPLGWTPAMIPAADVYETKDEFVVELEVPGYQEKELQIEVSDHHVIVKGEQVGKKEELEKTFRLHERLEKTFERRFQLPPEVETKNLKAVFKQGVLELHAPKAKALIPKKVPIAKG